MSLQLVMEVWLELSAQVISPLCTKIHRSLVHLIHKWEEREWKGEREGGNKGGRKREERGKWVFIPRINNFVCGSPFKYYY